MKYAITITVGVAALVTMAVLFRIRISNSWQQYARLPAMALPSDNQSIVVFSPHCDDETLGTGGLLALAERNGAKVHVVLMTNGDGFWYAASRDYKSVRLTPRKIIEFAYKRQKETLKALAMLSVPSSQVSFLGYPDRGLAHLWNDNWDLDHLFTSRTTKVNHSPYTDSYRANAPYCGESVLSDVESILKSAKPTDIYIPHPLDNHSDHYATYCFVMAALEQLHSEDDPIARKIKVHTYLVHRGDWPVPGGYHPNLILAPPQATVRGDTNWESLNLPANIANLKLTAIKQYRTQTAVEKGFLLSFARSNELFGDIPNRGIAYVKPGNIKIDGNTDDWDSMPPVIVDPVADYIMADVNKGGDVRAIYGCRDEANLYLRIDFARKLSKRIRYTLNIRGISGHSANDIYTVSFKPGAKSVTGLADWAYQYNILELALPISKLKTDSDLFIQVKTSLMKLTIDDTGWQGGLELGSQAGE